eukprot:scaffold42457_cov68-Phaeocystis_antarctica.AAC.5
MRACTSPEQRGPGGRAQHHRRRTHRTRVDRAARPGVARRPKGRPSAFEVGARGGERHQDRQGVVVLVRLEVTAAIINVYGGLVGGEGELRVMHASVAVRGAVAEEVVHELRLEE